MRLPLRPFLPILLLVPLACCAAPSFLSFPPQVRGNRVDSDQLKQLVPGTSTRADAMAALGSPTAKATFDDNTWIYIGEVTKPVIGGTLNVMDQEVVLLTFDFERRAAWAGAQDRRRRQAGADGRSRHALAGQRSVVAAAIARQCRQIQRRRPNGPKQQPQRHVVRDRRRRRRRLLIF